MSLEETLIIFKPETVERKLVHKLIKLWEQKGYTIVASRLLVADKRVMELHYAEHADKLFYSALVERMTRGPCIVMIVRGAGVIQWSRDVIGATYPRAACAQSVRGKYATEMEYNLVHASDSVASAEREIALWKPLL